MEGHAPVHSGNDWLHDYDMGYATSASPLGPFVKDRGNPILRDTKGVTQGNRI